MSGARPASTRVSISNPCWRAGAGGGGGGGHHVRCVARNTRFGARTQGTTKRNDRTTDIEGIHTSGFPNSLWEGLEHPFRFISISFGGNGSNTGIPRVNLRRANRKLLLCPTCWTHDTQGTTRSVHQLKAHVASKPVRQLVRLFSLLHLI